MKNKNKNKMKANELRIGNYVFDENNESMQIEHLQPIFNYAYRWEWLKHLKPIQLTEEWLLKFGFIKWKTNKMYSLKNIIIYYKKDIGYCYGKARVRTNIKYVNQLQNLYFALTGEELKIKQLELQN